MNEINFVGCIVLCALAAWIESLRNVGAMRRQAVKFQLSQENPRRASAQDMLDSRMEQTALWPELSAPNQLQLKERFPALAERVPLWKIVLNTPRLYLLLILMFWLLLL